MTVGISTEPCGGGEAASSVLPIDYRLGRKFKSRFKLQIDNVRINERRRRFAFGGCVAASDEPTGAALIWMGAKQSSKSTIEEREREREREDAPTYLCTHHHHHHPPPPLILLLSLVTAHIKSLKGGMADIVNIVFPSACLIHKLHDKREKRHSNTRSLRALWQLPRPATRLEIRNARGEIWRP